MHHSDRSYLKEVSIMMETIAKSQWKDYLDDLSKAIKDVPVEVEVEALGIFDKKEVEWLPLLGVSYDPKDDVVSILFEKLDHLVEDPQQIAVEKDNGSIKSIEIISGQDAAKNVLKFKVPVKVS